MIVRSNFTIYNSSEKEMIIVHEPEGFEFCLPKLQEVVVESDFVMTGIRLNISVSDQQIVLAILDDQNNYRVLQNGKDVFQEYL
jgi:hypothetical protein